MGTALRKLQQIEPKLSKTKSLCYTIVKNAPKVLLPHSEAEKGKYENFDFAILLSSFFFFFLLLHHTQLKNHKAHMNILCVKRMLYYRRGAFSGIEPYASHDWDVIIQNMHGSFLLRHHFVCTLGLTLQIIGCIQYQSDTHVQV